MKTLVTFVQPRVIEPPVATPAMKAWGPAAVRSGQQGLLVSAGDELTTVLRGADRESRELYGSASDPP